MTADDREWFLDIIRRGMEAAARDGAPPPQTADELLAVLRAAGDGLERRLAQHKLLTHLFGEAALQAFGRSQGNAAGCKETSAAVGTSLRHGSGFCLTGQDTRAASALQVPGAASAIRLLPLRRRLGHASL